MSIIASILASRSGLLANSTRAQVVSSNIANAQDETYSKRSVQVTEALGGGVNVIGIARAMDKAMDALYRTEVAFAAKQDAMSSALSIYTAQLGDLDSETSIPSLLSAFQNDLGLLANDPGDTSLQQEVLLSAKALSGSLQSASNAVSAMQKQAYTSIDADVETANKAMSEIARINADIGRAVPGSATYATLLDRRAEQIDTLSSVMQIEVTYDSESRATVHSSGGQTLVMAGYVNALSFDRATGVLTSGSEDVTPGVPGKRGTDQGSLAGHVVIATQVAPQTQLELDEIARSLIEGFEDNDASLAPGQAGLFTDGGGPLGATVSSGLAGRISVNAGADPYRGGDLALLRDGLGATTPLGMSDSTQVLAWLSFFDSPVAYDPAAGQGGSARLMDFTNGVFSAQQGRRVAAENALSSYVASSETYRANRLNARGVNIDTELQDLQLIGQAYNANSQALKVATEMIDTLLNMV